MIGGIILAAGLSTRMDGEMPKQLLPYRGRPLVAAVASSAVASKLGSVVVVTGFHGAEVAGAVSDLEVEITHNPDFADGNMTSFRAGYLAVPRCDAYVILLADMPGVTSEMINRFVDEWEREKPWAAVGQYANGRAHPLLLSAAAMERAAAAVGPRAVWRLLEDAEPDAVAPVPFGCEIPVDVNTVDEYRLLD